MAKFREPEAYETPRDGNVTLRRRRTWSILALVAVTVIAGLALGQQDDTGAQTQPVPPVPAPLTIEAAAALIESADPAVVAVLQKWLAQGTDVMELGEGDPKLHVALNGLAQFGISEAASVAMEIYRNPWAGRSLRDSAARALARLGDATTAKALEQIMWDGRLPLSTRCQAAATLVAINDDSAREFLLVQYDLYRLERRSRHSFGMDPVRDVLETIDDDKLRSAVHDRLDVETQTSMRNNITTLVARMQLNAQPLEALKATAADASWGNGRQERYDAIDVLGRRGGPQLIPFLQWLEPWKGIDPSRQEIQQQFLREYKGKAIAEIQRRHWRQFLSAAPTPVPGEAQIIAELRAIHAEMPATCLLPDPAKFTVRYFPNISHEDVAVRGLADDADPTKAPADGKFYYEFFHDPQGRVAFVVNHPPDGPRTVALHITHRNDGPFARLTYGKEGLQFGDYCYYHAGRPLLTCRVIGERVGLIKHLAPLPADTQPAPLTPAAPTSAPTE